MKGRSLSEKSGAAQTGLLRLADQADRVVVHGELE
jgi:hypothetical protein